VVVRFPYGPGGGVAPSWGAGYDDVDPSGEGMCDRAGVIVLASMGRQLSHRTVFSRGRRRECRLCSRASLWVVAVCVSGSVSAYVYDAIAWPAFNTASSPVAMPPQSSTRWMGHWRRRYFGMFARGGDEEAISMSKGLLVGGVPLGGVGGEIDASQMRIGLVG